MPFMAYDRQGGVIVYPFDLGFADPCGQAVTFHVFAFHYDATASRSMQSGDIAFIVRAGLYTAVDSGIAEDRCQVVGDLSLKCCAGLLGGR